MPLIVPGVQSNDGGKTAEWMNKLMGKKLGDQSNETTFAKTELPKEHRVLKGDNYMMTMDYNPNRLNIHTDDNDMVTKVTHG